MVLGREGSLGQSPRHLGAIGGQDQLPHLDLPGRTLFIVGDPAEVGAGFDILYTRVKDDDFDVPWSVSTTLTRRFAVGGGGKKAASIVSQCRLTSRAQQTALRRQWYSARAVASAMSASVRRRP